MARNQVCAGIVLRTHRIGEIHTGVTLFTDTAGLVSAIAHGANSPKGKLRGLTNPFCFGTVYLYTDPVKQSTKITDFDVREFFLGLRENVRRYYTASLWAEIILKSYGGGESSSPLFDLAVRALRLLDTAEEGTIPLISIQFLSRYLETVGTVPDGEECGSCGRELGSSRKPVYYSASREAFVCSDCSGPDMLAVQPGALRYLMHTSGLDFEEACRIQADARVVTSLQSLMYALVSSVIEVPLNTLSIGRGLL